MYLNFAFLISEQTDQTVQEQSCADPENFLRGGVQIPRRGLAENFNMAKINNLAIPGGGVPDPLSHPLDPPMAVH